MEDQPLDDFLEPEPDPEPEPDFNQPLPPLPQQLNIERVPNPPLLPDHPDVSQETDGLVLESENQNIQYEKENFPEYTPQDILDVLGPELTREDFYTGIANYREVIENMMTILERGDFESQFPEYYHYRNARNEIVRKYLTEKKFLRNPYPINYPNRHTQYLNEIESTINFYNEDGERVDMKINYIFRKIQPQWRLFESSIVFTEDLPPARNLMDPTIAGEVADHLYWRNLLGREQSYHINETRDNTTSRNTRFWIQVYCTRGPNEDHREGHRIRRMKITSPMLGAVGGYNLIGFLLAMVIPAWFTGYIKNTDNHGEYWDFWTKNDDPVFISKITLFTYVPTPTQQLQPQSPEPPPLVPPESPPHPTYSPVQVYDFEFEEEEVPQAGCRGFMESKYAPICLDKVLLDPVSVNNNCLFACVHYFLKADVGNTEDHEKMREQCGIKSGIKIPIKELDGKDMLLDVAKYYNICIIVYTIKKSDTLESASFFTPYRTVGENMNKILHIAIIRYHFVYILNPFALRDYAKCNNCYDWFNMNNARGKEHLLTCEKCDSCGMRKTATHKCRRPRPAKRPRLHKKLKKGKDKLKGVDRVLIADFETWCDTNDLEDEMKVYAVGYCKAKYIENELEGKNSNAKEGIKITTGPNALSHFVDILVKFNGIVVFYNGSRFDLWFILRELMKRKIPVTKFVKPDNKIISLKFNKCEFWDLCLFTSGSLKQLGKDFNIPLKYRKIDFDHNITGWEDVEQRKGDIIKYLGKDVACLAVCHLYFIKEMYRIFEGFNIINSMTLSMSAWDIWKQRKIDLENLSLIKLPTRDEYQFLRKALYGGRCGCTRKAFYSKEKDYFENHMKDWTPDQLKYQFNLMSDYLVYVDVVSLYPFASRNELPIGEPVFKRDLSEIVKIVTLGPDLRTEEERRILLKSYIQCDVICPKNILIPFVFARYKNDTLDQSLDDKTEQVLDGATIDEAQKLGYFFPNIKRWLYYPRLGPVLKEYMTFCFDEKAKTAKNKGKDCCEYHIYKLYMNGLTGKMNQKAPDVDQSIHYDVEFFEHDMDAEIKKVEYMGDADGKYLGFYVEKKSDRPPSKPLNLGVSILALSRVLMSQYLRELDGYKNMEACWYYHDTDSYVIHSSVYLKNQHKGVFGDEWGQLKNEFGEKCKIIEAYFLAPKTYALKIWTLNDVDGALKEIWHIRCKGIPNKNCCHGPEDFAKAQPITNKYQRRTGDLSQTIYSLFTREGKWICSYYVLPFFYFQKAALERCYCVCHYGSMDKKMVDKQGRGAAVGLQKLYRSLNYNEWWESGKRSKPDHLFGGSFPKGHYFYNQDMFPEDFS